MMKHIKSILKDNKGTTAIEYGLIISLIAATIALTLSDVSGSIVEVFNTVNTKISTS